jgi:hypothetical protein
MQRSLFAFALAIGLATREAGADPPPEDAAAAAARADEIVRAIATTSGEVRRHLRTARAEGAAKRVACFDRALSRVDAAFRAARDEKAAIHAAAQEGDDDEARARLSRVVHLRASARDAASAGAACAAPEAVSERTTVRVIVDPDVARVAP